MLYPRSFSLGTGWDGKPIGVINFRQELKDSLDADFLVIQVSPHTPRYPSQTDRFVARRPLLPPPRRLPA